MAASSRVVEVLLRGKDALSGVVQGARRSLGDFAKFATGIAAGIGATFGAISLGRFFASSVEEAANAERAYAQVGAAIRNVGGDAKAARPEVDALVTSLSQMSGRDDEAISDALTRLITLTGNYRKALDLLPTALDVAAGRQMELGAAADLVAKAANGNTAALTRMGIAVQDGADAVQILRDRFGGFAAAEGQTLQGMLGRISVAWGDVKEAVGRALTGHDSFAAGGNRLVQMLVDLEGWIRRNEAGFRAFASAGLDILAAVGPVASFLGSTLLGAFQGAQKVIGTLLTGFRLLPAVGAEAVATLVEVFASSLQGLSGVLHQMGLTFGHGFTASFAATAEAIRAKAAETRREIIADWQAGMAAVEAPGLPSRTPRNTGNTPPVAPNSGVVAEAAVTALDEHAQALVALAKAGQATAADLVALGRVEAALARTFEDGTKSAEDRASALRALGQVQDALGRKDRAEGSLDPKADRRVETADFKDPTRTVSYENLAEAKLAPLEIDLSPKLDKDALEEVTGKIGEAVAANDAILAQGYQIATDAVTAFGTTFGQVFGQVLQGNLTLFGAIAKGGRAAVGAIAAAKAQESFVDAGKALGDAIWKKDPSALAAIPKLVAAGTAYAALASTLGGRGGSGGVGSAGGGGGGGLTPNRFQSDSATAPQNTLTIVVQGGSSKDSAMQDWLVETLKGATGRGVTVEVV